MRGRLLAWAVALAIAALTLFPLAVLAAGLAQMDAVLWLHLRQHVLPELLRNTFWLALGVGGGVTLLGVSLAWLTAACRFPGQGWFDWALLLPLALPAYITAFVWVGWLDFTGTLPTWLREGFGLAWHPPVRSLGGAVLVLTLALYPYVYLTARAAFLEQGSRLLEVAQSLGVSRPRAFLRVVLPVAWPGIIAGLLLALMETLADFGAVAVLNVNTFTTAIYHTWFGLFSLQTASQLALMLAGVVLALVLAESWLRGRQATRQHNGGRPVLIDLHGWRGWLAAAWCGTVLLLAFLMPMLQLVVWSAGVWREDLDLRYFGFVGHSLWLGALGAMLVVVLAVALAYARRLRSGALMLLVARFATLGYALPGAVLAVGFFIPVAWLDRQLADAGIVAGPVLAGTIVVMLLAYASRFLAVGFGPVEAGLGRIGRNLDEASATLGVSGWRRLARVHLPLLRVSLLGAAALVFVDILKELPMTLMTRPFGWDTLAVRVFEMTSEGEWQRAALPALAIVLAGLLPVMLLIRQGRHAAD